MIPIDARELWKFVTNDPGTGVVIVDVEGCIHYANHDAADLFGVPSADALEGYTMAEVGPETWTKNRLRLLRDIVENEECVILRSIWLGRQLRLHIHVLKNDESGGARRVFVTVREVRGPMEPYGGKPKLIWSEFVNLGRLDALTKRELEVLALIGSGMSVPRIAELLHRSIKTIERHKASMSDKLKVRTAVELAKIADAAGLAVEDAYRTRIKDEEREAAQPATEPAGSKHC